MKLNFTKAFFLLTSLLLTTSSVFAAEKKVAEKITEGDSILKSYVIIESETVHEINPHLTSYSSDAQLLTGLYEGLFTYNPVNLEPVPAVAVSYKISRDKKRWTFKINPEARFSNGEKITASSVRKSWIKLLSEPAAPYASLLDVIYGASAFRDGKIKEDEVGIYATDDETLLIHLEKPANYLPRLLCHSSFAVVYDTPDVFSGPFVLDDSDGRVLILRKNPYYWDKDNVFMEQINFIQSSSADDNSYYFNTGLADWICGVANYDTILNKDAINFNAQFGTSYVFFKKSSKKGDGSKKSVWDKKEFRQALMEAVPWEILRKGVFMPAETFVYPLQGYPVIEGFNYTDVIEAKKLMKAARAANGIAEDQLLTITLEIPKASIFTEEDLFALTDAWNELGVQLIVRQMPNSLYYADVATSDADLFTYSWIGDFADPLAFLELFRGNSSLNDSGWYNKKFDMLLNQAAMVSEMERYRYLAEAEELLLDDYMVMPIQHPSTVNVINTEETAGWAPNAFDIHPLKYLRKVVVPSKIPNVI